MKKIQYSIKINRNIVKTLLKSRNEEDNELAFYLLTQEINSEDLYLEFKQRVFQLLGYKDERYFDLDKILWLCFTLYARQLYNKAFKK